MNKNEKIHEELLSDMDAKVTEKEPCHFGNVIGTESSTQSESQEMIDLKCETCGTDYKKPAMFKVWNDKRTNVFYRWSLAYCDKCRRSREVKALERLPEIMKEISNYKL
jgi:hypothetical protein